VVFVDLNLDVLDFDHLLTIEVFDNEHLSYDIFDNIFENNGIPNIFVFLVGAIHLKKIVK